MNRELDVRLLGAIELRVDGAPVDVGGHRAKAVLALLALHAGRLVLEDALVDEVWADDPPPSARNALQSYVSRLRRVLPDGATRLVRHGPGYALRLDRCELDVQRFEDAVDDGERALAAGRAAEARLAFARAFIEWEGGDPLLELWDERFARAASARLTDRWLSAVEADAEAALGVGAHRSVVARLEDVAHAHPLREDLWRWLVVALFRAGRQVDALRRYDEVRRTLTQEVGVEPGPALRAAHLAVLRQTA